ncbi:MAG: zinc ABC transporter substrate-binding protein, partial [Rhodospirillaceae bacterium]|nr:zinc ABC transporter substrate-binding protein [Rhodospirillaceae bacterium]
MQRRDVKILAFGLVMATCGLTTAQAQVPKVVTSIAPLSGIAAAVMKDIGTPTVLLPPGQSPHHAALKPSQARALAGADVVLWIGPDMEAGLDKALDARPQAWFSSHVMTAMSLPGMTLRPFRHLEKIGVDDDRHNDHHDEKVASSQGPKKPAMGAESDAGHHHHGTINPHLWLDIDNAVVIAGALADRLAVLDAEHAERYHHNAAVFADSLVGVKKDIAARLSGLEGKGFVVFHDAYAYFEAPFGLGAVAALTLDPAQPIGGQHLIDVRDKVRTTGAVCIFA